MLSLSKIGIVVVFLALSMPHPVARVDRLYWDHVEGFCVDLIGKEIYAGSRNRLYYSSDFGQSWRHLGDLPKETLIGKSFQLEGRRFLLIHPKGLMVKHF